MSENKPARTPGTAGNRGLGRPKGSRNKKTLLRQELERDGSALAAALKAKALEGDSTCLGLWLARLDPPLRARAPAVEFAFDSNAPLSTQVEQITQAIADGRLSVEEGRQMVEMIRQLAEVRALEGKGNEAEALVRAFKQIAVAVNEMPGLPYHPPAVGDHT